MIITTEIVALLTVFAVGYLLGLLIKTLIDDNYNK